MDRKTLEGKNLTTEQIDFVLKEHGKDIQAEQKKTNEAVKEAVSKATSPLNEQLEAVKTQIKEYEEKLKGVEGLDEATKTQIAELQKEHAAIMKEQEKKLKEVQLQAEAEVAKMKREAETKEFFSTLGKKFVTPETAKAFESRLNEALVDKTNEGKNRKDIFEALIKGEDGTDRSDIFAVEDSTSKPLVVGASGENPGVDKSVAKPIPTII